MVIAELKNAQQPVQSAKPKQQYKKPIGYDWPVQSVPEHDTRRSATDGTTTESKNSDSTTKQIITTEKEPETRTLSPEAMLIDQLELTEGDVYTINFWHIWGEAKSAVLNEILNEFKAYMLDTYGVTVTINATAQSNYNTLLEKLQTSYNKASSKTYMPLTEEEKEVMSDREIEKWEQTGKENILSKDENLRKIIDLLKGFTSKTYSIDGEIFNIVFPN